MAAIMSVNSWVPRAQKLIVAGPGAWPPAPPAFVPLGGAPQAAKIQATPLPPAALATTPASRRRVSRRPSMTKPPLPPFEPRSDPDRIPMGVVCHPPCGRPQPNGSAGLARQEAIGLGRDLAGHLTGRGLVVPQAGQLGGENVALDLVPHREDGVEVDGLLPRSGDAAAFGGRVRGLREAGVQRGPGG